MPLCWESTSVHHKLRLFPLPNERPSSHRGTGLCYHENSPFLQVFPPVTPPKFILRDDLTLEIRTAIAFQAYMAQQDSRWGVISQLARTYQVSRQFIYGLLAGFKAGCSTLFMPQTAAAQPTREELEARILAYRLEGRCSLSAISTLMQRDGLPFSSQGAISEWLTQVGQALPNTLRHENDSPHAIVFSNDEVYAKSQPILITVDPVSSAILSIELADNRSGEQWCQHYERLLANGYQPKQLTSDAGPGICAANTTLFPAIPWQLDTFHSVAHRLGDWGRRLAKRIDSAITCAADREATLDSAKSDAVIDKRLTACFAADRAIEAARCLHENFRYLYREIIRQLNLFDATGKLRKQSDANRTITVALELMEELDCPALHKDITSVSKALPDCLTYFGEARQAVKRCESLTNNTEALATLYLSWQWDKASIKSKQTERRQHALEQRQAYLEWAMLLIGDKEKTMTLKQQVFQELDQIIQASSIVECINSLLRPYLNNSKNQITQAFLNLFMFYHNHRRYRAGKRKGMTPMEMLTGKVQEDDWLALLQKQIRAASSQTTA